MFNKSRVDMIIQSMRDFGPTLGVFETGKDIR